MKVEDVIAYHHDLLAILRTMAATRDHDVHIASLKAIRLSTNRYLRRPQ